MPSSLCPRHSIIYLVFALVTLLKCLYVYMDLTCFICCFHVSTSFSRQFSIFFSSKLSLKVYRFFISDKCFFETFPLPCRWNPKADLWRPLSKILCRQRNGNSSFLLDSSLRRATLSCGKNIANRREDFMQVKKCACLFSFLWCLVTNVKSHVHIWSIAQTFFWFVTHSFPGLRDGSD